MLNNTMNLFSYKYRMIQLAYTYTHTYDAPAAESFMDRSKQVFWLEFFLK